MKRILALLATGLCMGSDCGGPSPIGPAASLPVGAGGPVVLPTDHVLGDPAAPVTVVEYGDYQCPFCGAFARSEFPTLKRQYIDTGRIRFVYRHFPLRTPGKIHDRAEQAARAAECASDRGAFFEYHEQVTANQSDLSDEALRRYATNVGLSRPAFDACLAGGAKASRIQQDVASAAALNVAATPTFFVNEERITGFQTAEELGAIIDRRLPPRSADEPRITTAVTGISGAVSFVGDGARGPTVIEVTDPAGGALLGVTVQFWAASGFDAVFASDPDNTFATTTAVFPGGDLHRVVMRRAGDGPFALSVDRSSAEGGAFEAFFDEIRVFRCDNHQFGTPAGFESNRPRGMLLVRGADRIVIASGIGPDDSITALVPEFGDSACFESCTFTPGAGIDGTLHVFDPVVAELCANDPPRLDGRVNASVLCDGVPAGADWTVRVWHDLNGSGPARFMEVETSDAGMATINVPISSAQRITVEVSRGIANAHRIQRDYTLGPLESLSVDIPTSLTCSEAVTGWREP